MDRGDIDDLIKYRLEDLRTRLLNLSTNNRLLSTKFSQRSRSQVRAVDELPDILYDKFISGSMTFKELPPLEEELPDEQTRHFKDELEYARITDPQYLEGLRKLEEQGEEDTSDASYDLERALKDRVREKLSLPPRQSGRQHLSLPDHARAHHINPDYDLPIQPPGEIEERWRDSEIQLLLLQEQMRRTLDRILDQARTIREETGIDTLYAAFGFLEWKETDVDKTHLAPLLLLPIDLERKKSGRGYRYWVTSRGDDPEVNITLAEKLRRDFGLELPDLDEMTKPEEYWDKIEEEIVESRPNWNLRRWVAFGAFPYARMAMWHDLDPDTSNLIYKPLVRDILGGSEATITSSAVEYDVDDPAIEDLTPVLVTDTDASQQRAVIDVMKKCNLVIKGPPGTGKSQTITNIIGAALYAGKTVLFMAEKMAALEIVYNRLREAGLDAFCLEVHSHKASRKKVLESFRKRLDLNLLPDIMFDRQSLRDSKRKLTHYVDTLNAPYGETGLTCQEILWNAEKVRERVQLPESLRLMRIQDPRTYDQKQLARARKLFMDFEHAHEAAFSDGLDFADHSWRGFGKSVTTVFDLEDLIELAKSWEASSQSSLETASTFAGRYGIELGELSIDDWEEAGLILSHVTKLLNEADSTIVRSLINENDRIAFSECLHALERVEILNQQLRNNVDESADPELVDSCARKVSELHLPEHCVGEITDVRERVEKECEELILTIQEADQIAQQIEWNVPLTKADINLIRRVVELIHDIPQKYLLFRTPSMKDQGCIEYLEDIIAHANELNQNYKDLKEKYKISPDLDINELKAHASLLENTGMFSFFSSKWRRARKFYSDIAISKNRVEYTDMAKRLRRIAVHLSDCRKFEEQEKLHQLLGSHFVGLSTDFNGILNAALFIRNVKRNLLDDAGLEGHLRNFLIQGDTDSLVLISSDKVKKCIVRLAELMSTLSQTEVTSVLIEQCENHLSDIKALEKLLASLPGLNRQLKLNKLDDIAKALMERMTLIPIALKLGSAAPREVLTKSLKAARGISELPSGLKSMIFDDPALAEKVEKLLSNVIHKLRNTHALFERICEEAELDPKIFFDGNSIGSLPITTVSLRARMCSGERNELEKYAAWVKAKKACESAGLGKLIDIGLEYGVGPSSMYGIWEAIVRRTQARDALEMNDGALMSLSGSSQAREREYFQSLEHKLLDYSRRELMSDLLNREIPHGVGYGRKSEYTNLYLIRNELNKQKRFIPLRALFSRAIDAIQVMKPCFLMSPQSVAQYLPRDQVMFDLVVIDEASQMKPEEAIGSLARASHAVIVGDEKQLPPTDFFERALRPDVEEEEFEGEEISEESILESALTVYRPHRELRWHYRSRHSELIAFSNMQFYDNALTTFPSAHEGDPDYGIRLIEVDGIYSKRINVDEVKAIVAAALDHMKKRPNDSLGIVTINQPQRELIREELDYAISLDRSASDYISHWQERREGIEQLFVKNLENVQGDERDVIIISTVYGPPTKGGKPDQRFGPINSVNGHRRLNVLFTRAKKQTLVFTSLKPADIVVEGKHRGVQVFRDYLSFAKTKKLSMAEQLREAPESPFEELVIERIEALGCEAVPQVGVHGYRIDIGVKHASWPYGYIMGVECDGAMYHSVRSARERDRLRQEVLEGLGWTIYRIWSTDWFNDPVGETRKLRMAIERRLSELRFEAVEEPIPDDKGRIKEGDTLILQDLYNNEEFTYRIIPGSTKTPLDEALIAKEVGDIVEYYSSAVGTTRRLKVLKINRR